MSVIVIDAALREKLLAAGGVAEFRDEAGNLIGRYVAWDDPSRYERPEMDLSEEEVKRRLAPDAKTYSTAEVMEYLRGLE